MAEFQKIDCLIFIIVAEWPYFDMSRAAWSGSSKDGKVRTGYERYYVPQQRNINSFISTFQHRCAGNLKLWNGKQPHTQNTFS